MTHAAFAAEQTLAGLFSITPPTLAPSVKLTWNQSEANAPKAASEWSAIKQLPYLPNAIAEQLCKFLDIPLIDIFAGAWHTWHELRESADATRANPSLTSEVALTEHEFSYETSPSLELLVNGHHLTQIPMKITAAWTVRGIVLSLSHGCVATVRSGQAECKLELACGSSVIFTHKLAKLDLPLLLKLAHPLDLSTQAPEEAKTELPPGQRMAFQNESKTWPAGPPS